MFKNNKKQPLVSIIINCYNGEKFLEEAIKSVINQTYKNLEIVFFDNNSSDKSSFIAKNFQDNRIKIFKTKKTYALYKARNLAIKKTKGKYICFLDVDDWWARDKLKTQIDFFIKNKNQEVVFSNLYIYKQVNFKTKIFIKKKKNLVNAQEIINSFQMPILTSMIEKKIFKRIKFNNNYTIIGDFDFFIRLSLIKKINYLPVPLAFYRQHDQNLSIQRLDLNIKELRHWVKKNINKKIFENINFDNINNVIELMTIKKNIISGKRIKALKLIFKKPFSFSKIKYLFFIKK